MARLKIPKYIQSPSCTKCILSPSSPFSALRKTKLARSPIQHELLEYAMKSWALFTLSNSAPHMEGQEACALGASSLIKQLEKQSASTSRALCFALIKVIWDHLFKISNLRFGYYFLKNSQQSSVETTQLAERGSAKRKERCSRDRWLSQLWDNFETSLYWRGGRSVCVCELRKEGRV